MANPVLTPHTPPVAQTLVTAKGGFSNTAMPVLAPGKPLDLSRMTPPTNEAEFRLEEITIDGICGVY